MLWEGVACSIISIRSPDLISRSQLLLGYFDLIFLPLSFCLTALAEQKEVVARMRAVERGKPAAPRLNGQQGGNR